MGYVQGIGRRQTILFPDTVDEYIEEDNPVQFVDAFVDSLDLRELEFKYSEPEPTGRPPYNPADMLKLYLYGYLNRIRSSRKLERESRRNVELMWLLKKLTPDFKTIADFRKDNRKAIKEVCREFTLICKRLDLFGGELVAIDSSKFRASNSKKRNFNEAKLQKRLKEIEEKIEGYLRELEENDSREAGAPAVKKEELEAKVELLKERGKEYTEVTNDMKDYRHLGQMSSRAKTILGVAQLEVLADKGYYNGAEIKRCVDDGVIPYIPELASTVSKEVNVPRPEFYNTEFRYEGKRDLYICPEGKRLRYTRTAMIHGRLLRLYRSTECVSCHLKGRCTRYKAGRIIYRWEHEKILEEMRERVKENQDKVKKRQWLAEHPFGTIKRGFDQGYMLTRGIENVGAEISLSILAYNIKRVLNIVGMKKLLEMVRGGHEAANGANTAPPKLFSPLVATQRYECQILETTLLFSLGDFTWAN